MGIYLLEARRGLSAEILEVIPLVDWCEAVFGAFYPLWSVPVIAWVSLFSLPISALWVVCPREWGYNCWKLEGGYQQKSLK